MPTANSVKKDYRGLVISLLKQKTASFLLGVIILFSAAIYSLNFFSPRFSVNLSSLLTKTADNSKGKSSPTNKVRTYVVQPGDQLYLIAEKIYGSGLNMQDIMKANNIKNPDSLEIGQTLILPEVKAKFPTKGSITDTAASTAKDSSERYVVKQGDDLAKIALETYGDSYAWVRIAEANNLVNPDNLQVGMILIIPR